MKAFLVAILLLLSFSPIYANKLVDEDLWLITQSKEITELESYYNSLITAEKINNKSKFFSKSDTSKFWSVVYAIETHQGLNLYRPKNSAKNCRYTSSPCGHYQLSVQALNDIGCTDKSCKKNREDYSKSLAMSKKLQVLNTKRLTKSGIINLPEYQRYLIHQQGAYGIKTIINASKGQIKLSKKIKNKLANNSPYTFRMFKNMSSQQSALIFLYYWKKKWKDQKERITVAQLDLNDFPTFTQMDLDIALNLRY